MPPTGVSTVMQIAAFACIVLSATAFADPRAREARIRRFGPEVPLERAQKVRQARFLQYRGFSSDHIRSALGPDFDLD